MGIKGTLLRGGIAAATVGALTAAALTGAGTAFAASKAPAAPASGGYQFVELGSTRDVTFNQLLGINNKGVIAGYFGSGNGGHPNKGYQINPPYAQGDIASENFPGSVQTQVTGLNDDGVTVGFYSTQNKALPTQDNNFGWWAQGGHFHKVDYPTSNNSNPPVNQLLGVNNSGTAVGFYNDSAGNSHGYAYNLKSHAFKLVAISGASSVTAAAINNHGDVAGFFTKGTATDAFLKLHSGKEITISVAGAMMTQAFGVNDKDWVAGTYTLKSGATFGFIYILGDRLLTGFSDPNGVGTTLFNGINNENDIVGFYTDSAGNTDGMLALPPF
jgi:hypothetical protein